MSSVVWVLESGSYLVSSKEHLLTIMQLGSFTGDDTIVYTPSGDIPPSYITSDFKQTVDIDLEDDSNCYPIGRLSGTSFTGVYDGGSYSISNFTSTTGTVHALFGFINTATLKDIVLSGTWTVTGLSSSTNYSAALCARIEGSSNLIERIDINGTVICTGTTFSFGTLVSRISGDTIINDITVRGIINASALDYCGGVISWIAAGTTVATNIRYVATGDISYTRPFVNGQNATNAIGGIVGTIGASSTVTLTNIVNSMMGNIDGVNVGGIVGMSLITNVSNAIFTNMVNGMTGNLTSGGGCGGIFGRSDIGTSTYLLNVMKGVITSTSRSGGISGVVLTGTATNCIVAMNGDISGSSLSTSEVSAAELSTGTVTMEWATSDFGLTVFGSSITDILTKPVASSPWAYHADFPEIPYLEMTTTDSESNISYVETPFPNISGNSTIYDGEFDYYTVAFNSTVSPVETTIGISQATYSLFKFDTVGFNAVSDPNGISFVESPYSSLLVLLFSHIVYLQWFGIGESYGVSYTETGSSEVFYTESTMSTNVIIPVTPGVEYVFSVYVDGILTNSSTAKTSPIGSGASVSDILEYVDNDISGLSASSITGILEYIGDALDTLDVISANIDISGSIKNTALTFVDLSDTINITGVSDVLIPFSALGGPTQNVTLELSTMATEIVTYNELADEITVETNTYGVGDTFVLDNKKVKVASLL